MQYRNSSWRQIWQWRKVWEVDDSNNKWKVISWKIKRLGIIATALAYPEYSDMATCVWVPFHKQYLLLMWYLSWQILFHHMQSSKLWLKWEIFWLIFHNLGQIRELILTRYMIKFLYYLLSERTSVVTEKKVYWNIYLWAKWCRYLSQKVCKEQLTEVTISKVRLLASINGDSSLWH